MHFIYSNFVIFISCLYLPIVEKHCHQKILRQSNKPTLAYEIFLCDLIQIQHWGSCRNLGEFTYSVFSLITNENSPLGHKFLSTQFWEWYRYTIAISFKLKQGSPSHKVCKR